MPSPYRTRRRRRFRLRRPALGSWFYSRLAVLLAAALLVAANHTDLVALVTRAYQPLTSHHPAVEVSAPYADDLGGLAEVSLVPDGGMRVLAAPDAEAETRAALPEGTCVDVLAGPVQAAGGVWYRVRSEAATDAGWAAAPYLAPADAAAADGDAGCAAARAAGLGVGLAASAGADAPARVVAPGPLPYVPVRPLPATPSTDARFGLVEAFRLGDRDASAALGARYERLVFWWSGLQATPGAALNPHYLSLPLLDRARGQGRDLVGVILSTPAWAAANPSDGPRSVPRNLDRPWDDPQNDWGRFVERLARDYAGRVDDWIVWNEPDIQLGDPNASYYTWAGGVEDYYQLLRVAYRAAKKGNPAARVHLAGLTYWVDQRKGQPQYFERLLDRVAADETAPANNGYFDVATLHLYTDPRALYHVPRLYRELMRARGLDKPIWIDETNVIPWDDATNRGTGYDVATEMRCTLADQASYLLQAFALGLAGGAERLAVYKAQDSAGAAFNGDVDAIERAALVREDGSLRPAYVAYQTAARYLAEAQASEYFPGPIAETVVVDRAAGRRTTVLWNASARPAVVQLGAVGDRAELVDAAGRRHKLIAAPDGDYRIALPPASCNTDPDDPGRYVMGGETYLLVEYDVPDDAPRRPARTA